MRHCCLEKTYILWAETVLTATLPVQSSQSTPCLQRTPYASVRYLECDGSIYIYDPATNKLFLACEKDRKEITTPKQRGTILVNSSSMSEEEFNCSEAHNLDKNAM